MFKSLFSKDGRESRAVQRWQKRLMNQYQQTQERKRAIEGLAQIGTEEAIVALLRRYQYRTEASITDEDEKEQVYHTVVSLGASSVPGLVQYIHNETGVYWPVKALRSLVGDEETVTHLLSALDGVEDVYGQNRGRREELVDNLREFADDDRVFERLIRLAGDEDEEIVIRAVDGLGARQGDQRVSDTVVPILLDDSTSHRVRMLIMELMLEQQWNVKRFKKQLLGKIPDIYWIDDTGVVRRK